MPRVWFEIGPESVEKWLNRKSIQTYEGNDGGQQQNLHQKVIELFENELQERLAFDGGQFCGRVTIRRRRRRRALLKKTTKKYKKQKERNERRSKVSVGALGKDVTTTRNGQTSLGTAVISGTAVDCLKISDDDRQHVFCARRPIVEVALIGGRPF